MDEIEILVSKIKSYNLKTNEELIRKAYKYAKESHQNQFRKSGEPYYLHPYNVALIITEIFLDDESICAALLHDVIEDTQKTYNDIKNEFGSEVADIVDGVTKLGRINFSSKEEEQIENLRKMFMAMANDIRVILIKLADRLHNMRTMKSMPEKKQLEKSLETMEIYAPIAHRLGMNNFKWELEDTSLFYLDPVGYHEISSGIAQKREQRVKVIDEIKNELSSKLNECGIQSHIEGRPKHFYSIYKKLYMNNKSLEEIYDLFAIRIIVGTIAECYTVLGYVHELYKPIPGRFKDYISMPKQNMYQSLHTTLMSNAGIPFEIQIRTWDMHKTAEYGIAAHWRYKEGGSNIQNVGDKFQWVRQLLETEKDFSNPSEYISHIKIDLFSDEVFVFSPKGDVYSLPSGSTPIDFAFMIHSAVGWRMTGSKINGRMAPIDTLLNNGDIIEIITSASSSGPNPEWLKIARTSQARSKINQWFKKEKREENIAKGKELLEKELKKYCMSVKELINDENLMAHLLKKYSFAKSEDFYAVIGYGGINVEKICNRIEDYSKKNKKPDQKKLIEDINNSIKHQEDKRKGGILVKGIDNCLIRTAKCCFPVPGDDVIGYITRGRGVTIHRKDCKALLDIEKSDGDSKRLVEVEWNGYGGEHHNADVVIEAANRSGLLVDVTLALNDMHVPIMALQAKTTTNNTIDYINVTLQVESHEKLESILIRLNNIKGVYNARRM